MAANSPKQALYTLTAIFQGLRLYPAEHPQVRRQLDFALANLLPVIASHGKLTLGLLDGTLLINDIPCLENHNSVQELTRQLERQQLQAVEFLPGLRHEELLFFCQELPQLLGGDFPDRLEKGGVTAIRATLLEDEPETPRAIYHQALQSIEKVCRDVRLGQIPSSKPVISSVKHMVKSILSEPYALLAMSLLKDYDNYTFTHSVNVAVIALAVGQACGLSEKQLHTLGMGALLHDLGKMTIDHGIVAKPGRLSDDEFEVMQQHPENGARIVAEMEKMPAEVLEIVNGHHLRYDRTGYPVNRQGEEVSPLADMTSIADTYDAMTTVRCYQRPRSPRQAVDMMRELGGNQLHPEYLQQFLDHLGPYPVGTLVRLADGCIGLVVDMNREQHDIIRLKIIFAADGSKYADPPLRELAGLDSIVAEVDPVLKGIRLEDYLAN